VRKTIFEYIPFLKNPAFGQLNIMPTKYHLSFIRGVHMYKVCYETCHLEQTLVMNRDESIYPDDGWIFFLIWYRETITGSYHCIFHVG